MRYKLRIKNTEMKVIKWERIWNNNKQKKNRERGRGAKSNEWYMLRLQAGKHPLNFPHDLKNDFDLLTFMDKKQC